MTAKMTQLETIENLLPLTVVRFIHLRDELFLVGYGRQGIIEVRDFSKAKPYGNEADEPVASFNASELDKSGRFDYLRDFDCKDGDESKIVAIYDSGTVLNLNMKDKSYTLQ